MPRASLSSVTSYTCDERTVILDCTVEFDDDAIDETYELSTQDVNVHIEFYNPETFRFVLFTDDRETERDHRVEFFPDDILAPVSPTVTEAEGVLTLTTAALELRIGLEDWSITVSDRDGTRLLEEQHDDLTAKQDRRTDPLGFTVTKINQWPYRTESTSGSFTLYADEHIYGFGEKFTEFDKRGQRINSWITQPNGAETEDAYKNVPFYLSTRGYGLLVDTVQHTTFDIGNTSTVSKEITVDDDRFAFVFCYGPSFTDILDTYTGLTGRPGSVPKWSLGVWMSRLGYQDREELEAVATEIRRRGFPCDVFNLDPPWLRRGHLCDLIWDRERFPDPEGLIDELHDDGFKLCLWEYPYLLSETEAFDEAIENDYLLRDPRGGPYLLRRLSWAADHGAIVDFTNPEARAWWKERHKPLLEMGVDVFKTDFGEYVPRDAIASDGRGGSSVRNQFSTLYTGTVHEAMVEAGSEPIIWARPGWTGGQRYPVHWGGDPNTTFESMAASLRGGLSLALSGYAFWSCDIGGFHGKPSPELYVRWAQFGLLGNSHARFHGTTPREPWEFGEDVAEIVGDYARERYRLLPYLHRLAIEATETGIPVIRPLVLEFQHDRGTYAIQTQLMLGDSLLVAPVVTRSRTRDVYLPEGEWVDYWTDERFEGGQTITVETPLETMPVFHRAGTVIPTREPTEWIDDHRPDLVTLRTVLPTATGMAYETTVYEFDDDGGLSIEITAQSGGEIVVQTDGGADGFALSIRAVETGPKSITVDGQALERVDREPGAGEWHYDEASREIAAIF